MDEVSRTAHRYLLWPRLALFLAVAAGCVWATQASLQGYRVHVALNDARAHTGWGRLEDAALVLRDAVRHEPTVAELHMALGAALESLARFRGSASGAEAALEAYARAAELDPLAAAPHAAAAWVHVFMQDTHHAARALERALARDPNNSYYLASLGHVRELQGDVEAAAALYRRSLAILADREVERRLERLASP